MTTYQKPGNDVDRLNSLRQAHQAASSVMEGGPYLSVQTLAAVQSQANAFDAAIKALAQAKAQRSIAISQAENAALELSYLVQEARRYLRQQVNHGKMAVGVLNYYHIPAEGRLPQSTARSEWLSWAELLISGDSAAQADGFAALLNGAALVTAHSTLKAAEEAVSVSKNVLMTAREQAQAQRTTTDELIRDLTRELRFNLARLPLPRQREIMRTYGLRFRSEGSDVLPDAA